MASESGSGGQPGILNLELTDKASLYAAYMPFVRNGGLFIPVRRGTAGDYALGDELFLLLHLRLDGNDDRLPIAGRVIWVTPSGAQGQRTPGVGMQFSTQDSGAAQQRIEAIMAGSLDSDRPTNTL